MQQLGDISLPSDVLTFEVHVQYARLNFNITIVHTDYLASTDAVPSADMI